ncbi:MAG TPA: hypothetical protein ACQGQJ_10155 [Xylella fastidiosa subsp. multiplex]
MIIPPAVTQLPIKQVTATAHAAIPSSDYTPSIAPVATRDQECRKDRCADLAP